MRLLTPGIEETVAAEIDIFGRDAFADRLLNLFHECDDALVLALDEKWGTGKTVFAKRLAKRAAEKQITAVYFDAFKRDYDPDVFVSLAAELLAILPKDDKANSFRTKAKSVGKILTRVAFKSAVRAITFGATKTADFGDAATEIENAIGDVAETEVDRYIDERLKSAEVEEQTFESFRKALGALCSDSNSNETAKSKRVLIIVDELDRCRPDHALNVLETIKHFFSVPNVHFLLICNKDQIVASIKKIYGADLDASEYLEKFIHLTTKFPRHGTHEQNTIIDALINNYCNQLGINNSQIRGGLFSIFKNIDLGDGVLLRKIQRVFVLVSLTSRKLENSKNNYIDFVYYLTVFLCYMKHVNLPDYERFKQQKLSYKDILERYEPQIGTNVWFLKNVQYLTLSESQSNTDEFSEEKRLLRDPCDIIARITTQTIDFLET